MKRPLFRQKSQQSEAWQPWYKTARWQKIAKAQLAASPLCVMCQESGRVEPATVCDHIVPHKGNHDLFWNGEMQSLCKPCHDGRKRMIERRGYVVGVTADGRPRDPNHPWNKA